MFGNSLQKLSQEDTDNLNRLITRSNIESVINIILQTEDQGQTTLLGNSNNSQINLFYPSQFFFLKDWRSRNTPKGILWSHHNTDTKTRQRHYKKANYKQIMLLSIDAKILKKILASWVQQHIKRIKQCDQAEFIPVLQGWFNIYNSTNVICHINNNQMIEPKWSWQ